MCAGYSQTKEKLAATAHPPKTGEISEPALWHKSLVELSRQQMATKLGHMKQVSSR